MILYNILIFTFGFWNVFKKHKSLSTMLGFSFVSTFSFWIFSMYGSELSLASKTLEAIFVLLGLSLLGFILIALSNNKLAQIGAIIISVSGVNLYLSNPHTPLDPNIRLQEDAELIIRVDHNKKSDAVAAIANLSYTKEVTAFLRPLQKETTKLDDYYTVDIIDGYDLNFAISEINEIRGVDWLEPNEVLQMSPIASQKNIKSNSFAEVVSDPMAIEQWNMEILNMKDYLPLFKNSKYKPKKTAKVFILDSGVASDHPDLRNNFLTHISNDTDANESDKHGHGTHCAGIAGGVTNNGIGIASMSPGSEWVTVGSVKVMNNFGFGSQSRFIEGIIEAVDAGADVISASLGSKSNQIIEESYREAIQYAKDNNVIIVAAAGNNAGDASEILPAKMGDVITVSAIDRNLKKAQFSNYVSNTSYGIAAPGVSILSTYKGSRYATFDGTSMATPHVAGLIAVMRSINPELSTAEAFKILDATGINTKDNYLTGKMINPVEAIKKTVR